jgi:hypothetical protein
MNDHRPTADEIVSGALRAWSPSAADAGRVRQGLGAAVSTAAGTSPDSPLSATTRTTSGHRVGGAAAPSVARWAPKLVVAGLIAAGSGGAGYWAGLRAERPPGRATLVVPASPGQPPLEPTVQPVPDRSVVKSVPTDIVSASASVRAEARGPRRGSATTAPTDSESLAVEVRAVRNAERALRDGTPGLALAFLRELDHQVPRGRLMEERQATYTLARCARHDQPMGIDLGGEFVERYPHSVYRPRIEQACAATDPPASGDSPSGRSRE